MTIHREGYRTLVVVFTVLAALGFCAWRFLPEPVLPPALGLLAAFQLFILSFFRKPARRLVPDASAVYAPADGRVVAIEEVNEPEYFKGRRRQISIFMSPLNVHINWCPVSGTVAWRRYHKGKYLVAWHPKSSTENERTTVVIKKNDGTEILLRQIAGTVARRIVCYANEGAKVQQGDELGFIRFGSRVDLFLPPNAEVKVNLGQKVWGKRTIVAGW